MHRVAGDEDAALLQRRTGDEEIQAAGTRPESFLSCPDPSERLQGALRNSAGMMHPLLFPIRMIVTVIFLFFMMRNFSTNINSF